MLKEADVSRKGLLAFRDILSDVPSLTIDSIEELPAKDMPDYQAIVEGPGFKQIIYLQVKTLGTPKSTREAVNLLVRRIQNEPASYGVVIAPYISPGSAAICRESGIGYVDLSGNCSIAFQQIFINREKSGNQFPFKTGLSSIYSPKSERILRVLLVYPYRTWKTIDLAKEAQVSLGMITQVSKKLIEEEWLKKTPQGISLIQPENLLADWSNNYTIKRNVQNNYYSIKALQDLELEIGGICKKMNIPYALTGFSASNRLAPMVRGQRAMIYVGREIDSVAEKVGLKPVESGANVILIQPYDDGVFWNAKSIGDLEISEPIQVYLDLKRYPGRGEEAADFLFREVINPRWQQRKMNMIAS
ncbi:MAG: hypothetical protein GX457_15335 [Thermotogaceae bacterium]|nr:hypothetical protein [Thermotogaceae bacterium]